jgi:hypothetical protein
MLSISLASGMLTLPQVACGLPTGRLPLGLRLEEARQVGLRKRDRRDRRLGENNEISASPTTENIQRVQERAKREGR